MTATFVNPFPQFIDDEGNPGFQFYWYFGEPDQDSVANPKDITDLDGVLISNPQIANAYGQPGPLLLDGEDYSLEVWDGDATGTGTLIWRIKRFNGSPRDDSTAFRGALVYSSVVTTAASGIINFFDTSQYDTDNIRTSNTALTVPSGVTKVKLSASVYLDNISASAFTRYIEIIKNGSEQYLGGAFYTVEDTAFGASAGARQVFTPVINVQGGDDFEVRAVIAPPWTIESHAAAGLSQPATWFAMEIIE